MTTTPEVVALSAALIMGLSGSAHCFGMCGGLASALGMRLKTSENAMPAIAHATLYQVGRISGYALMGALCGGFGQALQSILNVTRVAEYFRVMSGVLLLLVAARLLLQWNGLVALERVGARLWQSVRPLAGRLSGVKPSHTLLLGMIWGLLPCGLVYSMLAFAALSGSALNGLGLMVAFGLGTAPSMLLSTIFAAKSVQLMSSTLAKKASGALLVVFGLWLIVVPMYMQIHGGHSGHIH